MPEGGEVMAEVDRLNELADAEGLSLYVYTIRRALSSPGITSVILGLKRPEKLAQAISALKQNNE